MARNTRLWSNPQAHIRQFEGNIESCLLWYGWAQAKLGFMLNSHPGPVSQTFMPIDGITVHIDTRPNRIAIKAEGGIYLESGFLELFATHINSPFTYKPALLHYNTDQAVYMLSLDKPTQGKIDFNFYGEQLPEGYQSKSVGCALAKQTDVIIKNDVAYTAGPYCDNDDILRRKQCMAAVPASMFSGKMRLFVQSLYGSTRKDYYCEVGGSFFDYTMYVSGFNLSPHYTNNTWLVTTATYDYFVVKFIGDDLLFYPLIPSEAGGVLRKNMLANLPTGDVLRRQEAYILSTCTIGSLHSTVNIGAGFIGSPLAWGWHVKWDGLRGQIVLMESKLENTYTHNRLYELIITPTLGQDGSYTFTARGGVLGNSGDFWTIYDRITVLYPSYYGAYFGQAALGHRLNLTFDYEQDFSAPIYVTVDENDLFQPCWISQINTEYPASINFTVWHKNGPLVEDGASRSIYYVSSSGGKSRELEVLRNGSRVAYIYAPYEGISELDSDWHYSEDQSNLVYSGTDWLFVTDATDEGSGLPIDQYMTSVGHVLGGSANDDGFPGYYWGAEVYGGPCYLTQKTKPAGGGDSVAISFEVMASDCEAVMYGTTVEEKRDVNVETRWLRTMTRMATGWSELLMAYSGTHNMVYGGLRKTAVNAYTWDPWVGILSYYQGPTNADTYWKDSFEYRRGKDNLVVLAGAYRSRNYHFAANWPENEEPINHEPWLSTSRQQYFYYILSWGVEGFVTNNDEDDWLYDASVGWA